MSLGLGLFLCKMDIIAAGVNRLGFDLGVYRNASCNVWAPSRCSICEN